MFSRGRRENTDCGMTKTKSQIFPFFFKLPFNFPVIGDISKEISAGSHTKYHLYECAPDYVLTSHTWYACCFYNALDFFMQK